MSQGGSEMVEKDSSNNHALKKDQVIPDKEMINVFIDNNQNKKLGRTHHN